MILSVGLCALECGCPLVRGQSPSDEPELVPNLEAGRRNLGPDPLVLPQWLPAEAEALATGRPANLGGGLWTEERYPLDAVPPAPATAEVDSASATAPPGPLADSWLDGGLAQSEKHPPPLAAPASVPAATARAGRSMPSRWWLCLPGIAMALATGWFGLCRWWRRAGPCEFPEVEVGPRLGAPHSGGSGAVVQW